jgi:hypothetical protein
MKTQIIIWSFTTAQMDISNPGNRYSTAMGDALTLIYCNSKFIMSNYCSYGFSPTSNENPCDSVVIKLPKKDKIKVKRTLTPEQLVKLAKDMKK